MTGVRVECGLGDVVWVHAHMVVPAAEVDLGEEAGALQLIEEVVKHRDREFVLDGGVVEGTIVDTEALAFVVLVDQEHRGGKW